MNTTWLDVVRWNEDNLAPVVVQDKETGVVLMVAWMNPEALQITTEEGYAAYWSRSRNKLWRKGEESGHRQKVSEIRLDCDEDVILLVVEQIGGIACHTGRNNCFYRRLENGEWNTIEPVLKNPESIYGRQT